MSFVSGWLSMGMQPWLHQNVISMCNDDWLSRLCIDVCCHVAVALLPAVQPLTALTTYNNRF